MGTDLKASIRITLVDEANAAAKRVSQSFSQLAEKTKGLESSGNRASTAAGKLAQAQADAREEGARLSARLEQLQASGEGSQAEIAKLSGRIAQLSAVEAKAGADLARLEGRIEKAGAAGALTSSQVRKLDADILKAGASASSTAARLNKMAASSGKVGGGLKTVAAQSKAVTKGSRRLSKEQKASNLAFAEGINLTTELAFSSLSLSKATMPLGIALAGAGNNAYSFARFMGPIPILLATMGTAIPGVIGLFKNLGSSTDDAAAANRDLRSSGEFVNRFFDSVAGKIGNATERTREFLSVIDEIKSADSDLERIERIRRGEATPEEVRNFRRAAQFQLTGEDPSGRYVSPERRARTVSGQAVEASREALDALTDRSVFESGILPFGEDELTDFIGPVELARVLEGIRGRTVQGEFSDVDEAGQALADAIYRRVDERGGDARGARETAALLATDSPQLRRALKALVDQSLRARSIRGDLSSTDLAVGISETNAARETLIEGVDPYLDRTRASLPRRQRDRFDTAVERGREGDFRALRQMRLDEDQLARIIGLLTAANQAKANEERRARNALIEAADTLRRATGADFFSGGYGDSPRTNARSGR